MQCKQVNINKTRMVVHPNQNKLISGNVSASFLISDYKARDLIEVKDLIGERCVIVKILEIYDS